ncbi:hypothetical protein J7T55_014041 [Diaporthe amygdali]|uniref:uncharacterized protein n=1 Tax=Phomopsis amygdali TaxID=1214568 RepID=UPI0022FEFAD2|nr:uncharacterized protein J7T55_014041 [Diaporthe amygdali]KAJ0119836.1 hypothetical protein J7T55_014041 [Diaporthe amygdali]
MSHQNDWTDSLDNLQCPTVYSDGQITTADGKHLDLDITSHATQELADQRQAGFAVLHFASKPLLALDDADIPLTPRPSLRQRLQESSILHHAPDNHPFDLQSQGQGASGICHPVSTLASRGYIVQLPSSGQLSDQQIPTRDEMEVSANCPHLATHTHIHTHTFWPLAAENGMERRILSHIAHFLATARSWIGVYNKGSVSVI